jgi:4-amino-4-deoxy-L-arabinose transferase-like glycosyltransferase
MSTLLAVTFFSFIHYAALALFVLLSYVIGRTLTMRWEYHSFWEKVVFCASLGLGFVAYLVFILGILRWLYTWIVLVFLTLIAVFCFSAWRELWKQFARLWMRCCSSHFWLLGGFASAAVLLPFFILPLYPPTTWDSTMYHLAHAKIYVQNHALTFTPYIRYSLFPQIIEMLFTLMLMVYDDVMAQLTQFLMMVLVAIALYAWGLRFFTARVGLWSAALWLGTPLVIWLSASAYIDIGLTLFVLLGTYAFYCWQNSGDNKWLILTAVFCGLAAASKYTGLFFVAIYSLIAAIYLLRRRQFMEIFLFAGVTFIIAVPWYLRGYYYSGNPFLPYFSEIFGHGYMSPEDIHGILDEQRSHGINRTFGNLLLLPWHLAFNQWLFDTPAPLGFGISLAIPLLIIGILKNYHVRQLSVIAVAYLLFWFFSFQMSRFLLPILPMLSLAAMAIVDHLIGDRIRGCYALQILLIIGPTFALLFPGWAYALYIISQNGLPPVTAEQRDAFLSRMLLPYEAISHLNTLHGNDYVLYVLYAENMAYFVNGFFLGDWIGPARYSRVLSKFSSGAALYDELKAMNVDYFLYTTHRYRTPLPDDADFHRYFRLIYAKPYVQLYELAKKGVQYQRILSPNLLLNPSFEQLQGDGQPLGWEKVGEPSIKIVPERGVVVEGTEQYFFTQGVPIHPGLFYLLNASMKSDGKLSYGRMHINWRDSQGNLIQVDIQDEKVSAEWEQFSMVVKAPKEATTAWVVADAFGDSVVWFDDFSLHEVSYTVVK